jgi:hypothetical protein
MMPTEIVIEMEEEEITALNEEYGELLGVENLVKEIVMNELKSQKDLKSLREETKILNLGSAKLNAALGQYEQLVKERIKALAPTVAIPEEALTVTATDTVAVTDTVNSGEPQPIRVGLDVQRVGQDTTVPPSTPPVTNQLLQGDAAVDAKVKAAMAEIRERNKAGAAQAAHRKGATNVHQGGIVASQ